MKGERGVEGERVRGREMGVEGERRGLKRER